MSSYSDLALNRPITLKNGPDLLVHPTTPISMFSPRNRAATPQTESGIIPFIGPTSPKAHVDQATEIFAPAP